MKAHLDAIEDQKTIEIREHDLMDIQLLRKYGRFKESIEKALRGYIDQLLSEVIAERRAYDREQLLSFSNQLPVRSWRASNVILQRLHELPPALFIH